MKGGWNKFENLCCRLYIVTLHEMVGAQLCTYLINMWVSNEPLISHKTQNLSDNYFMTNAKRPRIWVKFFKNNINPVGFFCNLRLVYYIEAIVNLISFFVTIWNLSMFNEVGTLSSLMLDLQFHIGLIFQQNIKIYTVEKWFQR